MTVRREITKPRRETGARSLDDLRRPRTGRRGSEGRARRPSACRNSGSVIAAEVFMNHAGWAIILVADAPFISAQMTCS